jgi:hypothetical protein
VIDIENFTLKQLKQIKNLFSPDEESEEKYLGIRIVILQRGWVAIGKLYQKGLNCRLEKSSIIRRWGTSKGLGELANEGKKSETILDYAGDIEFHKLTEVANLKVNESLWNL